MLANLFLMWNHSGAYTVMTIGTRSTRFSDLVVATYNRSSLLVVVNHFKGIAGLGFCKARFSRHCLNAWFGNCFLTFRRSLPCLFLTITIDVSPLCIKPRSCYVALTIFAVQQPGTLYLSFFLATFNGSCHIFFLCSLLQISKTLYYNTILK